MDWNGRRNNKEEGERRGVLATIAGPLSTLQQQGGGELINLSALEGGGIILCAAVCLEREWQDGKH